MIKVILFDLDGTLIDSESYYVNGTIEWLSKLGIFLEFDKACGIIGKNMDDTYAYISSVSNLDTDTIEKENTNYFTNVNPLSFTKILFQDVENCFRYLKKLNIKIGICSMSSRKYIESFINECGFNDYIDAFFSGDECIHNKPDPEIYNKAIDHFKVSSKEVIIVEDAPSGLLSAKNSGAYVIARNDAKFGLKQNDALYILEDLKELNTIIMEINNGKYD